MRLISFSYAEITRNVLDCDHNLITRRALFSPILLPENQIRIGSDEPFEIFQNARSVDRRSVGPQYIHRSHVLLFATLGT